MKKNIKKSDNDIENILKTVDVINKNTIPNELRRSITKIIIPDNVKSIGINAFYDCKSLTSITIPNSVTSIGDFAFNFCKSLTSITIPNNVTSIGKWAFGSCESLTSITIPDSVTSIDIYAFGNCTYLTKVIFSSNSPLLNDIKNGEYQKWGLSLKQIFIKK